MTVEERKAQCKVLKMLLPGIRWGSDLVNGLFWTRGEMMGFYKALESWRPVRKANPCRRPERETIHCNSMKLRGMGSTLPHLKEVTRTVDGRLMARVWILQQDAEVQPTPAFRVL